MALLTGRLFILMHKHVYEICLLSGFLVSAINSDDTVDVSYVDFGNSERLPLSEIRKLPDMFLRLPKQVRICRAFFISVLSKLHVIATGIVMDVLCLFTSCTYLKLERYCYLYWCAFVCYNHLYCSFYVC